jgi:hypothetical protein
VAKPNYSFEKRQRELAKKRKKEEKAQRKSSPDPRGPDGEPGDGGEAGQDAAAPAPAEGGKPPGP